MSRIKKWSITILILLIIPAFILIAINLFGKKNYNLISIIVVILAMLPLFIRFEMKRRSARELMVLVVMCAIAVLGRIIFAFTPGFKPITAIVIIAGFALGGEAGFIIGALSALVSNIYFGQGPWTPFQMFSWGLVGFLAGLLSKTRLFKNWLTLVVFGVFGGVMYSVLMDVWTVLSISPEFNFSLYITVIGTSLPMMGVYIVSNVIFLLLLSKPFLMVIDRVKIKYNIFE